MTTTSLTTLVTEEGTMKNVVAFTDDAGEPVTPTAATWTLTTENGATIINSREDVVIGSLAASVTIVLSGDDLVIGSNGVGRVLTVKWVYDSDAGSDLPGNAELIFSLENLVNVP